MESNLTFFSLPFVDTPEIAYNRVKGDCGYEELHPSLGPHGSLLAPEDVLAQFLPGDEPLEEPDLNGPTTLHCEICQKQFDNAKKYYGHLRVHSKYNLWTCDKCPNERFSTKQQLMKHTLIHKPLGRVWKCPQCVMAFEALWRLQQHLFAKHLGYSPHKCDICEKSFQKPSDLKKHKTIHEDVRNYGCTECEAKFKDKTNLKRHMLTHGDYRPFGCKGCFRKYKQQASLKRHTQNCAKFQRLNETTVKETPNIINSKSIIMEHSIKPQIQQYIEPPKEIPNQLHVATNCTVDKIVDDILSAEDDYMTLPQPNILYPEDRQTDRQTEDLELLKDINNMHILDDELLYNDIDLDTLQNICNDKNIFDINDGRIENDIINDLYQKDDILNTEILNNDKDFLNNTVTENCSTIFETDIDLDASTNLTANLNQLIGENNVQYISTDNDDTFIISLNSEIDAEQLTDMLNISNMPDDVKEDSTTETENVDEVAEPIILKIEKPIEVNNEENKENVKRKVKVKQTLYICRKCNKLFTKKDNYWSHRAMHEPELRYHKCRVCKKKFGYKSTLNKHMLKCHIPIVLSAHSCPTCDKVYYTTWELNRHIGRTHNTNLPYACKEKGCNKKYYLQSDLNIHSRSHKSDRPFSCKKCNKTFRYVSHQNRHVRAGKCNVTKKEKASTNQVLLTTG